MNPSYIGQLRYLSVPLVLGVAMLTLATWVCFRLGLSFAPAACVYLTVLALLSLMNGFVSSAIFSVIVVGCLDFFFQQPLFDLRVESARDLTLLSGFLVIAIAVTSVVGRWRRLGQAHRSQSRVLDLGYDSARVRHLDSVLTGDSRRERARRAFEGRLYRQMMGMPAEPRRKLLIALFTEHGYLPRFICRRLRLPTSIDTLDRRVLERIILPGYLADPFIRRVLFVGCDNYTTHYGQRFFASRDYWTIEPNPKMRRYGAKQHVIAPLEQLTDHFSPGFFDLIICNGVYGWGLDGAEQCKIALASCRTCLAPGGHHLIGWDDIPPHRPAVLLSEAASLAGFDKFQFSPLGSCRYLTDTPYRHIYEFYQRPS